MRKHKHLSPLLAAALLPLTAVAPSRGAETPAPQRVTEAEAIRIGWPSFAGPTGNFVPLPTDVPLVQDISRARVLWVSDDRDLGTAKRGPLPTPDGHTGNWGSLIVAEGKVFGASMRPVGPIYEVLDARKSASRFQLDAEDVVLALDFHTGKTLWKDAIPGGLTMDGDKRASFQVTPVCAKGKLYSLGSTGRLFAHDAATGKRLWTADIGAAAVTAQKRREEMLAAAAAGKPPTPGGTVGGTTSLIVAEDVVVVTSGGGYETALRGHDAATGQLRWTTPPVITRFATPSVWRHQGREYILCANAGAGLKEGPALRLIDPQDGRILWTVTGIGPNHTSLAPAGEHVLVNVGGPKGQGYGLFGCYRLSPSGATRVWQCPDEPAFRIPTWMDTCAMVRHFIHNGKVHLSNQDGGKPPQFSVLDVHSGALLSRRVGDSSENGTITGLFYLLDEQTLLCRFNSSHGPRHGGRHPFVLWRQQDTQWVRADDQGRLAGMDLADFTTAYEILMETPVVAGRLFERLESGQVVCYDLRAHPETTWRLALDNGYVGLPNKPLETVLYVGTDNVIRNGKTYPPLPEDVGLVWTRVRNFPMWQSFATRELTVAGDKAHGTALIDFGSNVWPTELDIQRQGTTLSGTWTRRVPALPQTATATGAITGQAPTKALGVPTPWLKDQPWTTFADHPPGTLTYFFRLENAVALTPGGHAAGLDVSLDHDGTRFTRGSACAFRYNQIWHQIDPRGLTLTEGRITGTMTVLLCADGYVFPNPAQKSGVAGKVKLNLLASAGGITGTYEVVWGEAAELTGTLRGTVETKP